MCQFIIETGKEYQEENSKVSFKSICLSSMQFLYFYDYIFPSGSMMKNLPANKLKHTSTALPFTAIASDWPEIGRDPLTGDPIRIRKGGFRVQFEAY